MRLQKKQQNNFAFIDSQNINLGVQSLGWRIDFKKLRVYLAEKYNITKAFLFIGYVPGNESLYTYFQSVGYICIFKPTLELRSGRVKGNVDAELVLHTMIQYKREGIDATIKIIADLKKKVQKKKRPHADQPA